MYICDWSSDVCSSDLPGINPARISGMIGRNLSLFTSGISYSSLASEFGRAFRKGWVMKSTLRLDSVSALIICVGTAAVAAGGCLSLGNLKMKKLSNIFTAAGSAVMLSGLGGIAIAYSQISQTEKPKKIEPIFSDRKSTRLNSSHRCTSRMPSSA